MSQQIIDIGDDSFDGIVAASEKPVLVDFWAPWCGPCKAIAPMLEELAGKYGDQIVIAKCNIDDNQDLPSRFGVRSVPCLMFFKEGEVVDSIVGIVGQDAVENTIGKVLSGEKLITPLIVR
ncbi:MAG: thioredoxin [Deltaproteobacteria bacterium]|nr:thioredoxin [Deltaproteobacteria bacterium]MBW2659490.1 thioredoxin [Deltaproteobacteria bacterium]